MARSHCMCFIEAISIVQITHFTSSKDQGFSSGLTGSWDCSLPQRPAMGWRVEGKSSWHSVVRCRRHSCASLELPEHLEVLQPLLQPFPWPTLAVFGAS